MVLLGLCSDHIVKHERPLPEEMDTMRNIIDYHRLHYIQEHGVSEHHVAWLAKAADDIKREVNTQFKREIADVRKVHGLDKVDRPDIAPMIQVTGGSYNKREDESISGPGEPE
jgi:Asp-tRNA(Asn)/Glu-tRNA(Gln) amidotransferase C subunit